MLPAVFVFKSGAAGWLELPGELPPPEFPEFSAPDLPLRCSRRIHARQRKNRAPVIRQKVMPIGRRCHEKWFRHDVDQKIGPRIELPEIVGKEDFVENNKIFRKISGNDPGKQGGHAQK